MKRIMVFILGVLGSGCLALAASSFVRPVMMCPKVDTAPQIDGKIDDACWQKAAHISNYLTVSLNKLASEQTEAYACYDKENLYLAFKCHDSQADKIKARITERDANVWTDDSVEIFLDPELTRRYYIQLIANPLGTQQDLKITEIFDCAWNITWQSKAFNGDNYWSIELAIPFNQLGVSTPKIGERWGANFCREMWRLPEPSYWSPAGDWFHVPSLFGDLVFTEGPGISFSLDPLAGGKEVGVTVNSSTPSNLIVDVNTISLDGNRAASSQEIKKEELGKMVRIPYRFAPSRERFFLNVTVKNGSDKSILYQSPNFPLEGEFLESKMAKAQLDLDRLVADTIVMKAELKTGQKMDGYVLAAKRPFEIVLPADLPKNTEIGGALKVFAAPGEYEPATFLIYTTTDLKNVGVTLDGNLKNGRHAIPEDNVNFWILKRWYQERSFEHPTGDTVLTPELLLKNDNLVIADHDKKRNILNFKDMPEDSQELLPFDIAAYNNGQIWLTINVPAGTPAGLYKGEVAVKPEGVPAHKIPLEVAVLPIELMKPAANYYVYYHNCIGGGSPIGAKPESYEAEIKDMVEHGMSSVLVQEGVKLLTENGQRRVDMTDLKRALDMRVKYGLTAPTMYMGFSWTTKEPDAIFRKPIDKITAEDKETFIYLVSEILKLTKANPQYPELIFLLNIDEPAYDSTGGQMKLAALNCEWLHKAGVRTADAITKGGANQLGSLLDIAILDEPSVDKMYQKENYTKDKRLEYFYWHPVENPTHDRLRFGLVVWKTKLDGAAPWVYQWAVPRGWTEGADGVKPVRNLDYTYPAKRGVISTIQWEASREGIDDIRYLTTLEHWIKEAEQSSKNSKINEAVAEAKKLLELPEVFRGDFYTLNGKLTPADFEDLRSRVAASIVKIKELLHK